MRPRSRICKKENKKENDRGVGAGGSVVQTGMGGISHTGVCGRLMVSLHCHTAAAEEEQETLFLSAAPLLLCKVGWGHGHGGEGKKK